MSVPKGNVGMMGMIIIGAAIVSVMLITHSLPGVQKILKVRSEADIFVDINDQSTKIVSLLGSRTGEMSFNDMLAHRAYSGVEYDEIDPIMRSFDARLILDTSNRSSVAYGDRKTGDVFMFEIPVPGGNKTLVRTVTESAIPFDVLSYSGDLDYVVAIAKREVGPKESDPTKGSDCMLGNKYGNEQNGECLDWCSFFTSWVYRHAGFVQVPHEGSSRNLWMWFVNNARTTSDPSQAPLGSMAFWERTGEWRGHTGIVIANDGSTITTVEGNVNCEDSAECVRIKKYTYDGIEDHLEGLLGFGWISVSESGEAAS